HGRPTPSGVVTISLREPSVPDRAIALRIDVSQRRIVAQRGREGLQSQRDAFSFPSDAPSTGRPAFVPQAQDISEAALGQLWDAVVLHGGEERVIQCLGILAPVERITLIQQAQRRVAMARVAGRAQPVPLRSLGDGVLRAFQLALAIERSLEKSESPVLD